MSASAFLRDPTYDALGVFVAGIASAGVRHVCVCPGSRSTPLAVSAFWASRSGLLELSTHIDERAAGFFALGLAKASGSPVALICTSGSAAANFAPAVVEASQARVPLLLLTADRPPELWDWQAAQTIDQHRLYGSHAKWFSEVPVLAELAGPGEPTRYAESLAMRAVECATSGPAGPVHLNFPFREPLTPVSGGATREPSRRFPRAWAEPPRLSGPHVGELASRICTHERGVVVVGPLAGDDALASALREFSSATGWPVFADVSSSLRGHPALPQTAHFDFLLRSPAFAAAQRPEAVLQLGATPVSKSLRLWLESHQPSCYLRIDPDGAFEASWLATETLRAEPRALIEDLCSLLPELSPASREGTRREWASAFSEADLSVRGILEEQLQLGAATGLLQPQVALELAASLPDDGLLYSANSMPIRHLDAWLGKRAGARVLCNRGANGIDGTLSSALGAAAAAIGPVAVLCGDLAFLHDVGGLLAAHRLGLRIVCVVLNDDGGGIFSHLPVAKLGDEVGFEELFRMRHGLSVASAAGLYGAEYARGDSAEALRVALKEAWSRSESTVIEVAIDAAADLAFSRRVVQRLCEEIEA